MEKSVPGTCLFALEDFAASKALAGSSQEYAGLHPEYFYPFALNDKEILRHAFSAMIPWQTCYETLRCELPN